MIPTYLRFGDVFGHRLSQILYRCMEEVGSTKGAFYLLNEADGGFRLMSDFGWPRGTHPPERLAPEHPLPLWAWRERRSFVADEGARTPELADFMGGASSSRFLITPVYDRGDRVGLLIQRDPTRKGFYDAERDEPPTLTICQDLVQVYREFRTHFVRKDGAPDSLEAGPAGQEAALPFPPGQAAQPEAGAPWIPESAVPPEAVSSRPIQLDLEREGVPPAPPRDLPPESGAAQDPAGLSPRKRQALPVPPMPVEVPAPSGLSPQPPPAAGEKLEGFGPGADGLSGLMEILLEQTDAGVRASASLDPRGSGAMAPTPSLPLPPPPPGAEQRPLAAGRPAAPPLQPLRPGSFLPEQRSFFWETAALLCQVLPLAAVSLWMDEPEEIRPILTFSEYPLSQELKQQVMAHVTFHVNKVREPDLRILSRVAHMEQPPISGAFHSYLPVLLLEEDSCQDILLLFRMGNQPFSQSEQQFIQHAARMLGMNLQESRLHERYHRAFLSVSHRILASAESRSPHLRSHSLNTARMARALAIQMDLPSAEVESLSIAAILHDVGTLLLDPLLLSKPRLSPEEWDRMRSHPLLASAFLKDLEFPFDVLRIIRNHHERWDGRGYPDGLRGEDIPVGSRIIAVIEAYEVMSAGSPFRGPMLLKDILDELRREAGAQFDPGIVNEFLRLLQATRTRKA